MLSLAFPVVSFAPNCRADACRRYREHVNIVLILLSTGGS
jgi:hypothetical protein